MSDGGQDQEHRDRAPSEDPPIALPPLLAGGPVRHDAPRRTATIAWLALLLVLVLALVGTAPYWAAPVASILPWGAPAPEARPAIVALQGPSNEALETRLAAVEQKLDKAAQTPARDSPIHDNDAAAAIARLQATIQSQSDRLKALEDRPPPTAVAGTDTTALAQLEGELDKLEDANRKLGAALTDANQRLDRLEKAHDGEHSEAADRLLLVALGELRSAVANSGPYASELGTVEALARDKPAFAARLKPLEADAATGVPSLAMLTERFRQQAVPAILRADVSAPGQNAGWGERFWRRVRSLVLVRRVDTGAADASASPVDRTLATTETALAKGDLAAAVDAVASLDGAQAQAAAAWLAEARRRVAAETLLARLAQEVAAGVPSGTGDVPSGTGGAGDGTAPAGGTPKAPDAHE